jgi:hypothetical protein
MTEVIMDWGEHEMITFLFHFATGSSYDHLVAYIKDQPIKITDTALSDKFNFVSHNKTTFELVDNDYSIN